MASTYAELKRRLQLLVDRDDIETQIAEDGETVDWADICISNAERRFYRSEAARIPPFEKRVTYTGTTGTGFRELTIPEDYIEMNYVIARQGTDEDGGEHATLARVAPERVLNTNTSADSTGIPRVFAYSSGVWVVPHSSQSTAIDVYYYGALSPLSDITSSSTAHWLLNRADEVILYWAAVEASLFYTSLSGMTELWEQRGTFAHDQIVEQEARQEASGSTPMQDRPYRSIRSRRFGFHF